MIFLLIYVIRDTVCSVGFIPRYLPFVTSNSSIQYFRHALALDEHRAKFMPNYHRSWENDEDITPADLEVQAQGLKNVSPSPEEGAISPSTPSAPEKKGHPRHRQSTIQEMFEERINKSTGRKTDSLEVWFAGAHTGQHCCICLLCAVLTSVRRCRRGFSAESYQA
jgi:uncharacterized protein (DUF2235 family)